MTRQGSLVILQIVLHQSFALLIGSIFHMLMLLTRVVPQEHNTFDLVLTRFVFLEQTGQNCTAFLLWDLSCTHTRRVELSQAGLLAGGTSDIHPPNRQPSAFGVGTIWGGGSRVLARGLNSLNMLTLQVVASAGRFFSNLVPRLRKGKAGKPFGCGHAFASRPSFVGWQSDLFLFQV